MFFMHSDKKGFTILEIITVLLILGMMAVIAGSKAIGLNTNKAVFQAEVIKSHLRYAQGLAFNSELIWGIQFTGNTYHLFSYDTKTSVTTSPVTIIGEDTNTIDLSTKGVTLSETNFTISFDSWGKPYKNVTATSALASGDAQEVITVSSGVTITITPNTGFIP